jgi:hypothetical protein
VGKRETSTTHEDTWLINGMQIYFVILGMQERIGHPFSLEVFLLELKLLYECCNIILGMDVMKLYEIMTKEIVVIEES